jgi:glycosidase
MAFRNSLLAKARPASVVGVDLPRRNQYFPSLANWRDAVLYFLLPDRFSDGAEITRPQLDRSNLAAARPSPWRWEAWSRSGAERWQGGTLRGTTTKLEYLDNLGVTALWIGPIFKQRGHLDTYHGYAIADFLDVDPRLGTRQDLVDLVSAAHERGIRVILDAIFNHSGSNWAYPGGVDQLPYTAGQYEFGRWRGALGEPIDSIGSADDGVWPIELQNAGAYMRAGTGDLSVGDIDDPNAQFRRCDFFDLRKFALAQPSVLDALTRCYAYWIALTDCDGLRLDALKHVTLENARNFCGAIKEYAAQLGKENFFLLGEIGGGDANEDRYLDVLGMNMNAALDIGEMRPTLVAVAKGLEEPRRYFDNFAADNAFQMGSHRNIGNQHVSILDDHDEITGVKLRFSAGAASEHQVVAGVAMQLFTLGIPCIYYGTEQAFAGPESAVWQSLPEWSTPGGDRYLREAMFGPLHPRGSGRSGLPPAAPDDSLPGFGPFGTSGAHCFDPASPAYVRIAALARIRRQFPVLRGGRQYLRKTALGSEPFDFRGPGELMVWSRIMYDEEALCIVNTNGTEPRSADAIVDSGLNSGERATFAVIANTAQVAVGASYAGSHRVGTTLPVQRATDGSMFVSIRDLGPSEVLVLDNRA